MAPASPALDAAPAKPYFLRLRLDQLEPSPNNPRRTKDSDPALRELAESLRTLGQIEPIVVREIDADRGVYEILAGERRWRASKIAGLEDIEAKIMVLSEQQALEITVVENLQREQLDPLSEARGVATLLSKGWDVPTIASHLGKSTRWVHLRSGLTKLTKEWVDAMSEPTAIVSRFSAGHLELVARLTPDQQDAVLHQVDKIAKLWDGSIVSVEEFADILANKFTRDLYAARFDLHDTELVPKAGACTACPKRSSCQQELFGDLLTGGKRNPDHCLDDKCWDKKDAAWLKQQEKSAREQHGDQLVKIDPEHYSGSAKVLGSAQFTKAKPDTKGAVPALIVGDGADAGKTVWVKPKVFDLRQTADKEKTPEEIAAERARAKIERDRADFIGDGIVVALKKAKRPADDQLIRMAAVCMEEWDQKGTRAFDPKVKLDTLRDELWDEILGRFDHTKCETHLCKLAGIDHAALVASAAAKFPDLAEGVTEAKSPVVKRVIVKKAKGGKVAKKKAKK